MEYVLNATNSAHFSMHKYLDKTYWIRIQDPGFITSVCFCEGLYF
jgi:hypothetical protein